MPADAGVDSSRPAADPPPPAESVRGLAEHIAAFDYLRVIAACGIVWFHADGVVPRRGIGYAGLPVFVALTFFLLARGVSTQSLPSFTRKRVRRLAVPFVV